MPEDGLGDSSLHYDRMVEEALRGVVRRSLVHAAKHGLPGEHHFYITFRTDDPGAQVPQSLREQFPNEMTIVLQHQFWDLEISEEEFSVTLSFGDVPQKLTVPFPAVVAFADPSVQFGLQFDTGNREPSAPRASGEKDDSNPDGVVKAAPVMPREDEPRDEKAAERPENVVSFDSFRKKST